MTLYSNKVKHYPNEVRYYFDKVGLMDKINGFFETFCSNGQN